MDENTKIKVVNRTNARVGYVIPELGGLTRVYTAREEKIVPFEELRRLSYMPGGMKLIKDYLIVKDADALKELNIQVEPEYYYGEEEVKKVMQTGSLEAFLDCLDFAPDGVLELIKDLAVDLPLNDVAKRKAILDKLHFNVDKAVEMKEALNDDANGGAAAAPGRRVSIPNIQNPVQGASTGRRVIIPTSES